MTDDKYDKFIKDTMQNQPIINIGMIGHVANGKSTLVNAITGTSTQKHSDEKEKNITIRIGYANAKIFKCQYCKPPEAFQSTKSSDTSYNCKICNGQTDLISHVSFTDVPGHNIFMSTMLNGTCAMDYAIMIESASNGTIPAPQTIEHYQITKQIGIPIEFVCLNKIDLVRDKQKVLLMMNELRKFTENNIPVIPISGTLECNIDVICEYISQLQIPKKNLSEDFKMLVIRSFNVNNAKTLISEMKGGVIGGTLVRGVLNVGQEVILFPGHIVRNDHETTWNYRPVRSTVISIHTDKSKLQYAIPGGLIGVELTIDPGITKDDILVGQIVFSKNKVTSEIKIYENIRIKFKNLTSDNIQNSIDVIVNVNSNNIDGNITEYTSDIMTINLKTPICVELNDIITVNRPLTSGGIFILGTGNVIDGIESKLIN